MCDTRLGTLALVALLSTAVDGEDWPRWRDPNGDGVSKETGLLQQWPEDGPPLAWKATGIGAGLGGLAVSNGRVYTTGDRDGDAWLFVLDESNGKEIWRAKIGRGGNPGFVFKPAGPRSTPTVEGDRIYVLGQYGDFVCFTAEGEEVWRTDYVEDLGGVMPKWGYSESPLVDGERILCVTGGPEASLVAIERNTGKLVWKCRVPPGDYNPRYGNDSFAGYSSAIAVDFEGVRQYVQFTATTLVGVAASDGELLWRYDRVNNTHRIPCSSPIYHDGLVYASTGYDGGGGAVQLIKEGKDGVKAEEVYFSNRTRNQHGGMVLVDGYVYASFDPGILTCVDFKTGDVKWQSRDPGKGSVAYADGRLYCRNESGNGTVHLVEANPEEYVERGRFDPPNRSRERSWTHPVIANGKLYLRDQNVLLCYDVSVDG